MNNEHRRPQSIQKTLGNGSNAAKKSRLVGQQGHYNENPVNNVSQPNPAANQQLRTATESNK